MLQERRQNLPETDRGSYYNQEECLEEFFDDKGAFYNGSESDDSKNDEETYNENIEAAWNFIKNLLQHWCFPMKLENFLRKPFLTEDLR